MSKKRMENRSKKRGKRITERERAEPTWRGGGNFWSAISALFKSLQLHMLSSFYLFSRKRSDVKIRIVGLRLEPKKTGSSPLERRRGMGARGGGEEKGESREGFWDTLKYEIN